MPDVRTIAQTTHRAEGIAQRRTAPLLQALVHEHWSLRRALIAAYLQGVTDATQPLRPPPALEEKEGR